MRKSFLLTCLVAGGGGALFVSAAVAAYSDAKFAIEAPSTASNAMIGDQSQISGTSTMEEELSKATVRLAKNALDKQALAVSMVGLREENRSTDALKLQALLGRVSRRSSEYLRAEIQLADQTKDLNRAVTALDRWASMSPAKRKEIFSILILALAEPSGATLIKQRETRSWYGDFLKSGTSNPKNLGIVARYLLANKMPESDLRHQILISVIKGYLGENDVARAQDFAKRFGNIDVEWSDLSWKIPEGEIKDIPLFWQYDNTQSKISFLNDGKIEIKINENFGYKPIAVKNILFPQNKKILIRSVVRIVGSQNKHLMWSVKCGKINIKQSSSMDQYLNSNVYKAQVLFETNPACKGYELMLKYMNISQTLSPPIFQVSMPTIEITDQHQPAVSLTHESSSQTSETSDR